MEPKDAQTSQVEIVATKESEKESVEITDEILLRRTLAEKAKDAETLIVPENSHLGQAINLLKKEVDENPNIEHSLQVITKFPASWRDGNSSLGLSEMVHGSEYEVSRSQKNMISADADLHNHPVSYEDSFYSTQDIKVAITYGNQCSILMIPDSEGGKTIFMLVNDIKLPTEKKLEIIKKVREIGTIYSKHLDELMQATDKLDDSLPEEEIQKIVREYFQSKDQGMKDLFNLLISENFGLFVGTDGKEFARIRPKTVND